MSLANLSKLKSNLDLNVSTLKFNDAASGYIQFVCQAQVQVNLVKGGKTNITLPLLDAKTAILQTFPNDCFSALLISDLEQSITFTFVSSTKSSVELSCFYNGTDSFEILTLSLFFVAYSY
jgi:hypothetical protein